MEKTAWRWSISNGHILLQRQLCKTSDAKELENRLSQRRVPSLLLSDACGMMQPMK